MDSKNLPDSTTLVPLTSPEERLKLWQRYKGMWQNRTPDPIEELRKMRTEWDRELMSQR